MTHAVMALWSHFVGLIFVISASEGSTDYSGLLSGIGWLTHSTRGYIGAGQGFALASDRPS